MQRGREREILPHDFPLMYPAAITENERKQLPSFFLLEFRQVFLPRHFLPNRIMAEHIFRGRLEGLKRGFDRLLLHRIAAF